MTTRLIKIAAFALPLLAPIPAIAEDAAKATPAEKPPVAAPALKGLDSATAAACNQINRMYVSNFQAIDRDMKPLGAVQDSIVRHGTQTRLLNLAIAFRCDLRVIMDTEVGFAMRRNGVK